MRSVKAAGIEPGCHFNGTASGCFLCENREHPSAARALHAGGLNCHFLSSLDADLQRVVAAWDELSEPIKSAVLAFVDSQWP
jgi:hypothetical protein